VHNAIVTNDTSTARDDQPPTWIGRLIFIVVVSGVLAVLSALVWPAIEEPFGLGALNLSRFWVAIIVSATFSIMSFLVYFVADKTLWQFLQIIIVPLALTMVGFWFTAQQDARQQQIETQRAETERVLAEQRAQDEALQTYLDQMSMLLLEDSRSDKVQVAMRARTLTVLESLDDSRKKWVIRFLDEANLVQTLYTDAGNPRKPVVSLEGADLSGADLSDTDLSGAKLMYANLSGATLSYTVFHGADLFDADLSDATMFSSQLSGADLSYADLSDASLKQADLGGIGADLGGAGLYKTDLRGADLEGADSIRNEKLAERVSGSKFLEGATMPDSQKYEDWLKSKGRAEDGENSGPS
jgi:uncharacterized protein YjbI with pentapeptide repeats